MKKKSIILIISVFSVLYLLFIIPLVIISYSVSSFMQLEKTDSPYVKEIKISDKYKIESGDCRYLVRSSSDGLDKVIYGDIDYYDVIGDRLFVGYLLEDSLADRVSGSEYTIWGEESMSSINYDSNEDFFKEAKETYGIDVNNLFKGDKSEYKILKHGIAVAYLKNRWDVLEITEKEGYFVFDMKDETIYAGLSKDEFFKILSEKYDMNGLPDFKYVRRHRH